MKSSIVLSSTGDWHPPSLGLVILAFTNPTSNTIHNRVHWLTAHSTPTKHLRCFSGRLKQLSDNLEQTGSGRSFAPANCSSQSNEWPESPLCLSVYQQSVYYRVPVLLLSIVVRCYSVRQQSQFERRSWPIDFSRPVTVIGDTTTKARIRRWQFSKL